MTASEIAQYVAEAQAAGNTILYAVGTFAPDEKIPADEAARILALVADLATKALTAWAAAADTPITVDSVKGLLPNPTPLTPPDAA